METSVPHFLHLCINRPLPSSPHLKAQKQARSWGCGLDLFLDQNYRQGFWKSVILSKHQLGENPIVIVPLPLKATSQIWIFSGLTLKLKLAVFNCATKSVSIIGMSPK